jgi:hypothetical protein
MRNPDFEADLSDYLRAGWRITHTAAAQDKGAGPDSKVTGSPIFLLVLEREMKTQGGAS